MAHNAHYNGVFPLPLPARARHLYNMLDISREECAEYLEHKGSLDVLHGVVEYVRRFQKGRGIVCVSPR